METLGPIGAIIRNCWQVKYKRDVDENKDIEGKPFDIDRL